MKVEIKSGAILDLTGPTTQPKLFKGKSKPTGLVLYEGPSVLDGEPIIAIATLNSNNAKTGNMIQAWIMRFEHSPTEASKRGLDKSVCGMCPHRRNLGGACYVTLHQAPASVYRAYINGSYPAYNHEAHSKLFVGRDLRLGSYGDPAAVPFHVWQDLLSMSAGHTGYTHQYKHKNFDPRIADICMVSVDTVAQAMSAHKAGHKTFRVKSENMTNLPNEFDCLNSSHGISCAECGMCDGRKLNITINVHGTLTKRFNDKFARIL